MNSERSSPAVKKRVRVRIRARHHLPREGGRITRSQVALVLLGSAIFGAILGWEIGRLINKALEIKKSQEKISASWASTSSPGGKAQGFLSSGARGSAAARSSER